MRIKFFRAGFVESVKDEARRVVDEQANGRQPFRGLEDALGAIAFDQIGSDDNRTGGSWITFAVNMGHDRPPIVEQSRDDGCSDPLAASGYNCGPAIHALPLPSSAAVAYSAEMPESRRPIEAAGMSLAALAEAIECRAGPPPVDRWDPPHCGHSGMRIARDGTWFHEGSPIDRPAMTRLFSTVLRREADGSHVLVTPVEKLSIDVEVTPFRATQMTMAGEGQNRRIGLTLDSGDALIVGSAHPLFMVQMAEGPSPRVAVRSGLEAELSRPLYYELAEIAIAEERDPPGVWSDGIFFPLMP